MHAKIRPRIAAAAAAVVVIVACRRREGRAEIDFGRVPRLSFIPLI